MSSVKEAAREIVDHLPDNATWGDLMYGLYVKQKIEAGLKAVEKGRSIPHEEMKRRLLAKTFRGTESSIGSPQRTSIS